ncbi:HAD-IB family hydrolase [Escherichia coli]|nr:HAD-IB family hydrolase [Serratia marcescens]
MATIRFAFFDVDETLIGLKSMFSFRDFYLRRTLGQADGDVARRQADQRIRAQIAQGLHRTEINRLFWQGFKGYAQADVRVAAFEWHAQARQDANYYIRPAVEALHEHQHDGVEPVFVSGSSRDILLPLAQDLKVRHILANQLEVVAGRYTGDILAPQTIGDGKRVAIEHFLANEQACAGDCYGYGDHISDLPLLDVVGFPRVVAGNQDLMAIAQQRGWPVLGHLALQ